MARAAVANKPEQQKVSGTDVAKLNTRLPAGIDMAEMAGYEGAGTSGSAADQIVPFMLLLQDGSPQVKKRDPAYVEGAEPGDLYNSATRELWKLSDPDAPPLHVIPCYFDQWIVVWQPRDVGGGGFRGRHPLRGTVEDTLAKLGKQVKDPRDSKGQKMIWRTPDGELDLAHTRYQYCYHRTQTGVYLPCVLAFSSTGHTAAKQWMTDQNLPIPDTSTVPPAWFRQYRVRNAEKKNDSGSWFVLDMKPAGWVEDKAVRELGKALYDGLKSGTVKAGDEDGGSGGGAAGGDLPI